MIKFKISKSHSSNVTKSIRFSEDLNNRIYQVVENANQQSDKRHYSFNGFVCSACEFALEHLSEEFKPKD